ncbi:hypothetical protein BDQ17DRAFT_1430053 [Cyathus striatus]|nr:hypothetical protein BDQ17DRAFT_1430053 [Cyathus striatus]
MLELSVTDSTPDSDPDTVADELGSSVTEDGESEISDEDRGAVSLGFAELELGRRDNVGTEAGVDDTGSTDDIGRRSPTIQRLHRRRTSTSIHTRPRRRNRARRSQPCYRRRQRARLSLSLSAAEEAEVVMKAGDSLEGEDMVATANQLGRSGGTVERRQPHTESSDEQGDAMEQLGRGRSGRRGGYSDDDDDG